MTDFHAGGHGFFDLEAVDVAELSFVYRFSLSPGGEHHYAETPPNPNTTELGDALLCFAKAYYAERAAQVRKELDNHTI